VPLRGASADPKEISGRQRETMRRVVTITTMLGFAAAAPFAIAATSASAGGKAKAKPKIVKVLDDYYNPAVLKLTKGTEVKWVWGKMNYDSHNVTLIKGPKGIKATAWTSPTGSGKIVFDRKFLKPGTYHFQCTLHPTSMNMTIVVKG
jgi:plastocyanin